MSPQQLRPYQVEAVRSVIAAFKSGKKRVLMVMPTGGGKTSCFVTLLDRTKKRGIVLVHRRELATQAATRLREFGADYGMILAGVPPKPYARIQVASVQTLIRRECPPAEIVVCDEAHLSTAETWQTILDAYPNAYVLGVTATPWRMGGKPLVGAYDECIVAATPRELREQGFLSPYQGFSYLAPDLSGVKTVGGEFNEGQSAAAMMQPTIVTNIVEQWVKHARDLSTVVFAVTVGHSKKLTEQFRAAGVRAEHLDGSTPIDARRAILERVASGATQVLCNVGVAVEGLDIPRLKCCVLARPTQSLARAIQMMGRVRRPWNGVTAKIHDHAFVIAAHGVPDTDRDYTLNATVDKEAPPPALTKCRECFAYDAGSPCTACGSAAPVTEAIRGGPQELEDAEIVEFTSEDAAPIDVEQTQAVDVRWDRVGREIQGTLKSSYEKDTIHGRLTWWLVNGERRRYALPGTTILSQKLARVAFGTRVRIKYDGETDVGPGRRPRKEFTVLAESARAVA